jgi:hypothetical protein
MSIGAPTSFARTRMCGRSPRESRFGIVGWAEVNLSSFRSKGGSGMLDAIGPEQLGQSDRFTGIIPHDVTIQLPEP